MASVGPLTPGDCTPGKSYVYRVGQTTLANFYALAEVFTTPLWVSRPRPPRCLLSALRRAWSAANGADAIKLWSDRRGEFASLLTDLVMPGGTSGQQLARRLQAENPRLKIIHTSGYSAEIAGREIGLHDGENFTQKPCSPAQLLEAFRQALDG